MSGPAAPPDPAQLVRWHDAACAIAEMAGVLALRHYLRGAARTRKADGSFVTEGDLATETLIRRELAAAFPDHNVLGEEFGHSALRGGTPDPDAPTWVIDPIDATHNYMDGIPVWAVLIGLLAGDDPVLGVVHAPAMHETYEAARGMGARMNGAPVRVDPVDDLGNATLLYNASKGLRRYGQEEFFAQLMGRTQVARGYGEWWGHMLVARGAAHIMIQPYPVLKIWDMVAPLAVLTEAGARQTTLDGSPWTPGATSLTTCGPIHDTIAQLYRETAGAPPTP